MKSYENKKRKKKSNTALKIIILLFVIICVVSSFILVAHILKDRKAEHDFTKLQVNGNHDLVALHKKNHDLVGWIKVKGTRIDYPVMQTPNDPEFYLRRNFRKNYSIAGTPFLDAASDVKKSKNYLIYGHNIKSGTMFHQLLRFEKQSFYEKHKTFTYDQYVDGKQVNGTYEIVAAFRTQIYSSSSRHFKYYRFAGTENQKAYGKYVNGCKRLSEIQTDQDAVYPNQLVTLSTCAYHVENGRFVLVGVRIK